MPRGDGTGPGGQGAGTGRGMGGDQGGQRKGGGGGGKGRGGTEAGPGGNCVCPDCGEKAPHQMGTPCYDQQCPKCVASMTRE